MNKKLILLAFALSCFGCNQREEVKADTNSLYFDINGYFKREATRLTKINPEIVKEVSVNGAVEQRKLRITDWEKELAVFSNADINKASWRGSFKVQKAGDTEIYTSNNKRIPVKKLIVEKGNPNVKRLEIIITGNNILYSSGDTLRYYPDSIYQIKKHQKIKLLKAKTYTITGRFK